jgi:membrane protein DedA with SNARE-associated domain
VTSTSANAAWNASPVIHRLVVALGYWGIGVLMAVENIGLPIPSELIMPLGGFECAVGRLTLAGTILTGTIGSVIGALPVYAMGRVLFFGQLLPGVPGLTSLPAGFARMNIALFVATNFTGTLIWCTVLAVLGFLLGVNYPLVHAYVGPVIWVALGAIVAWGAVWLVRRRRAARRHSHA